MSIKQKDNLYIANTYARFDLQLKEGKGSLCYDENGKEYIDMATGIAVNTFGFCDDEWVNAVKEQVESLIWNATKTTDPFDGLLTIAKAEGTKATVAEANADTFSKVLAVYEAIPVSILDKAVIFVGVDTFRSLVLDCAKRNALNAIPDVDKAELTMIFPQSVNTKVVAVSGLNGTGAIVAADPANLFYGVDMQDDAEAFDLWYSKDNSEFRLKISFNAGTQIAFPDQVVYLV